MNQTISRRRFLGHSVAAGAVASGYFVNPLPAAQSPSPNEQLNLAIVGAGNKGWHNVQQLKSENIAVLCDVDANFLARAAKDFPEARQYRDYRRMLDAEAQRIDAVVVSTPDHHHAPATSIALDLGKHVYCEKPLTHSVQEARVIAELAKKNQLATQMGIQIHAGDNYRRVVELVRSGAIGRVSEVYTWCNKGWGDGRFEPSDQPAPPHLDWDLWLGPAPQRPYSPNLHPANWRRFWEYGSGTFGDMACHIVDLPFWALDLRHPTSVTCEGPEVHPDGAPNWTKAIYQFPAQGDQPEITLHWSDGDAHFDLVQSTNDDRDRPLSRWGLGILFVGDKGMLAADYGRHLLLPLDKFAGFQPPPQSIPASAGHWNEWVAACKTGSPTTCNFDYAGTMTETVLLGIVAYRTGKELAWDAQTLKATNCPEADAFVNKQYRAGWNVVGIA
jgi:predicted dehydrogenase